MISISALSNKSLLAFVLRKFRKSFPVIVCAVALFATACGPSVSEKREFPVCIRKHYATVKKVYNRETGEPEYVERDPDDPAVWKVICGLGGNGYTNWRIGDLVYREKGRLIVEDTPLPGETVTLDCYDRLPARPYAPRWRKSIWFPTDDGLYCRVPKDLH